MQTSSRESQTPGDCRPRCGASPRDATTALATGAGKPASPAAAEAAVPPLVEPVDKGRFPEARRPPVGNPAAVHVGPDAMDACRIAFKDDDGRDFVPARTHFRYDDIDLQRGEVGRDGGDLHPRPWEYDVPWEPLPLPPDQRS